MYDAAARIFGEDREMWSLFGQQIMNGKKEMKKRGHLSLCVNVSTLALTYIKVLWDSVYISVYV